MKRCMHQRAFYDTLTDQNMLICQNSTCVEYAALVNDYVCSLCPFSNLVHKTDWIDEPAFEPRSDGTINHLFHTICEQCESFNSNRQSCDLIKNSKVLYQILSNPNLKCPRGRW